MPYVSKLECEHNYANPNPLEKFPETCPICNTSLIVTDSGKTAICPNMECSGRSMQRMTNMFAKLNIKGFASATFATLRFTHLHQMYKYDLNWYINALGTADGTNLYNSLLKLSSEPIKDSILMGALGFTGIASKKWELVLRVVTLRTLYDKYIEYGDKLNAYIFGMTNQRVLADTIAREFKFFEQDILMILSWNNIIDSFGTTKGSKMQIRFTGCRNKQLSELLCNNGYDADDSSSVSKKTDILIVPYLGFTSNKVNKVDDHCKIIPIDEFLQNMNDILGEQIANQ
jgi:NAD-dependent DNA ligase